MKKIGYWLTNILLTIIFIFTCAGTIAEKSVGFGIATLVIVVLFILNIKKHNKVVDSKEVKELDIKYSNNNWQKIGSYGNAYLYINEIEKKVLINNNEYHFKDIISADIVENNKDKTYTATTQNAVFKRSYSSGSMTFNYCTNLQIKIVLNSISNPQEFITFIDKKTNKNNKKYKDAYEMSQKFLSVFQIITKNNKND